MFWLIAITTTAIALYLSGKRRPKRIRSNRRKASLVHPVPLTKEKNALALSCISTQVIEGDSPPAPTIDKDFYEPIPEWLDRGNANELTASLEIEFKDKAGKETRREITVRRYILGDSDGVIDAFCHLRNANRPFLISRIQNATCLETGEIIKNIPQWLDQKYASTPAGQIDAILIEHAAALSCLQHVAKADGAFRAKEKDVVRLFLSRQAPDADPAHVKGAVEKVARWHRMSAIGFGQEIRELLEKPEPYRLDVLETARAIVGTQKTVHTDEAKAVKRLEKELFKNY